MKKAAQTKAELARRKEEFKLALKDWKAETNLDDVVDTADVAAIVHSWTGIPVMDLLEEEMEKLLRMEDFLRERIIGQERAIEAVSDAIRRARSGLKDPRRPIWHLPLPRAYRHWQDRIGQGPGRLPIRQRDDVCASI